MSNCKPQASITRGIVPTRPHVRFAPQIISSQSGRPLGVIGGRTQSSEQVINAFGAVIASRIPPGTQINYVPSNINIEDVFNDFERMLSQTGSHSVTTNKPLAVSASKKVTPFGIRQQHSRHKKNND